MCSLSIEPLLAFSIDYKEKDREVSSKINNIFQADKKLYAIAKNVKIIFHKDAVFLEGHVFTKSDQIKIEHITRKAMGDKRLYNKITY
jgi:osmotically-inducible protein OsmY